VHKVEAPVLVKSVEDVENALNLVQLELKSDCDDEGEGESSLDDSGDEDWWANDEHTDESWLDKVQG